MRRLRAAVSRPLGGFIVRSTLTRQHAGSFSVYCSPRSSGKLASSHYDYYYYASRSRSLPCALHGGGEFERWRHAINRSSSSISEKKDGDGERKRNLRNEDHPPKLKRERSLFSSTKYEGRRYVKGFSDFSRNIRVAWAMVRTVFVDGNKMNRRERRFLARTLYDIVRMVPFAIVASVPGGSVFLPLFAKLFPSAMPSSFQMPSKELLRSVSLSRRERGHGDKKSKSSEEDKAQRIKKEAELRKRMEIAFRSSVQMMVDDIKSKQTEETLLSTQLGDFLEAVAESGGDLDIMSDQDLTKFAHRVDDEVFSHRVGKRELKLLAEAFRLPISSGVRGRFATEATIRKSVLSHSEKLSSMDSLLVEEGGAAELDEDELMDACAKRGLLDRSSERLSSAEEDDDLDALRLRLDHWMRFTTVLKIPVTMVAFANLAARKASLQGGTNGDDDIM